MYAGGQRGGATERALRLLSRSLTLGGGKSSENCIALGRRLEMMCNSDNPNSVGQEMNNLSQRSTSAIDWDG